VLLDQLCGDFSLSWPEWRSYPGLDERFNLGPNLRIAFNGSVAFEEKPVIPRISLAVGRLLLVVQTEIPEHRSTSRISCHDFEAAMNAVCKKGDIFQMLELASVTTPARVREKLRFALVRAGLRSSQQFG
jgi:hypothetical protein